MKKLFYIMLQLLLTGCICKSDYHELAMDRKPELAHDSIAHTGVIIGIEKYNWKCTGQKKGIDSSRYEIDYPKTKISQDFEKYCTQKKVMLVSHILDFKNGHRQKKDFYNPFVTNETPPQYEQGYHKLNELKDQIRYDLKAGGYTHLLFMSMGWHNDQYESLERYSIITTAIKKWDSANVFKPYLVGLTWPSSWGSNAKGFVEKLGHLTSYLNKPQDADEIGFTIANYLLHNIILNVVSELNEAGAHIKTIGVGHSLGARLISRAIFSREYLIKEASNGANLDLFIGLEPAFSANRFIKDNGKEGSPYHWHSDIKTKILITTSKFDNANPVAFWSEHLGGKDAFNTIKKNLDDYNFYDARIEKNTLSGFNPGSLWQAPKRVEYVNCEFIKDHNDILDSEMGLFLFEIITHSNI